MILNIPNRAWPAISALAVLAWGGVVIVFALVALVCGALSLNELLRGL